MSMEGAAQDSPSGRQRAAIPEGGTHLPDQGSKTRDKVLHCVAAALVPPAPGGSWGPAGLRQRPQRREASGRGEGEGCEPALPAAVLGRVLVSPVVCFGLELALVQQGEQLGDLL